MKRIKKIVQTRRLTHPDNLAGMYVEFTISGGQGNYQVEQEIIHPNKEQYSHYRTPYGSHEAARAYFKRASTKLYKQGYQLTYKNDSIVNRIEIRRSSASRLDAKERRNSSYSKCLTRIFEGGGFKHLSRAR